MRKQPKNHEKNDRENNQPTLEAEAVFLPRAFLDAGARVLEESLDYGNPQRLNHEVYYEQQHDGTE